jgi:hypothetical protein
VPSARASAPAPLRWIPGVPARHRPGTIAFRPAHKDARRSSRRTTALPSVTLRGMRVLRHSWSGSVPLPPGQYLGGTRFRGTNPFVPLTTPTHTCTLEWPGTGHLPPPRLVPTVFPMFSAILVACVSRVPLASVSLTSSRLLCCLVTISLWIFSLCSPPLLHFSLCSSLPISIFLITYLSLSFICPTTLLFSHLPRSVSL